MTIPDEAIEAASAYVHEQFHGSPLSVYKDGYQRDYKDTIRHALELAAPFMLAEAWDEFMKGKWDPMQENPYRAAK